MKGNRGEWSEMYIFFKVISDKRLYTADADFNKKDDVYLDVLSVLREEIKGQRYCYETGDTVVISLNDLHIHSEPNESFIKCKDILWRNILKNKETTFSVPEVEDFLKSIYVTKFKSPAKVITKFFGGTVDIVLQARDRSGVERYFGFSCKSDIKSSATLFNASGDHTNFIFEVTGPMNDERMQYFNSLFKGVTRKGKSELDTATRDRMEYLKEIGCDLVYLRPASEIAHSNLILSGGTEMPDIVGGMLKKFYFENNGSKTPIGECIDYLEENDCAGYGKTVKQPSVLSVTYRKKVGDLLYNSFTGMRFGRNWSGKAEVNGGYIVVKRDGDVVAFHSIISDEFREFLLQKMLMEAPSHKRHGDMVIYKEAGKYLLKLGLQLRFELNR